MTRSLHVGGVGRKTVTLAGAFAERGLDVDLVLFTAEGSFLSCAPACAHVFELGKSFAPSIPAMMRYLLKRQPDVVLSLMSHTTLAAIWARALARTRTRIIASVPNMLSLEASAVGGLKGRTLPWLIRHCYPLADGIVAVSHAVADDLVAKAGLDRRSIRVIYDPVVGADLLEKAKEPVDHPWLCDKSTPVILGAGRLQPEKDFETLIGAVGYLYRERPIRLIILGEGPERPRLERLIRQLRLEEAVDLPGLRSNPYSFMVRAAVFCLCSRTEGFGNVLVEAMACGCPVIATDCPGGPAEILEYGRYGELVPVGDAKRLSEALTRGLDSPRRSEEQRARAELFTVEASVVAHLQVVRTTEPPSSSPCCRSQ